MNKKIISALTAATILTVSSASFAVTVKGNVGTVNVTAANAKLSLVGSSAKVEKIKTNGNAVTVTTSNGASKNIAVEGAGEVTIDGTPVVVTPETPVVTPSVSSSAIKATTSGSAITALNVKVDVKDIKDSESVTVEVAEAGKTLATKSGLVTSGSATINFTNEMKVNTLYKVYIKYDGKLLSEKDFTEVKEVK